MLLSGPLVLNVARIESGIKIRQNSLLHMYFAKLRVDVPTFGCSNLRIFFLFMTDHNTVENRFSMS